LYKPFDHFFTVKTNKNRQRIVHFSAILVSLTSKGQMGAKLKMFIRNLQVGYIFDWGTFAWFTLQLLIWVGFGLMGYVGTKNVVVTAVKYY
jgi:hypothetical protein